MKIEDYKLVCALDPDGLEKKVKELIQRGWQPIGGVTLLPADPGESNENYLQAMVREFGAK